MRATLRLPQPATVPGAPRPGERRIGTLVVMVMGSLAVHGVAYAALASVGGAESRPPLPPAEVGFAVVTAPAEEEVSETPREVEPIPEPTPVAPRRAMRRRAPEAPAVEPEDHELGEPDVPPEAETETVAVPLHPETTAEAGLAVASAAPSQGVASGTGDDAFNRSGRAGGGEIGAVEPTPAAPEVDLKALASHWMKQVSAAVSRAAVREYPRSARRARLQGDVWLTLEVDAGGNVRRASLKRSSGHDCLDEAALAAVHGLSKLPPPPGALHAFLRPLPVPVRYLIR